MRDEPHSSIARIPELRWLQQVILERALTRGDYLLSGGARSDYYIDKFRLFSDPQILRRIARLFAPIVADMNPDLIAGTELGGVILASVVNFFMQAPARYWITSCAGVVVFVGLTAYDTQKIRSLNVIGNAGTDEDHKEAIHGALVLYLDFINLFLFLLRLLGRRR